VLDRVLSLRCSDREARLTSSFTKTAALPTFDGSGDFRRRKALKHPGTLFDGIAFGGGMFGLSSDFMYDSDGRLLSNG
jgi:hypothetical protein